MQTILNRSKILAFFACSFWIIWCAYNTNLLILPPNNIIQHHESIWTSIGNEFQLDHQAESPRVQKEIRSLLADQAHLNSILQAASPYIYFIHHQVTKKGLPAELALIPFIESEFNPNDRSKVGATGLWQLMPQTAKELGIKIKASYDGRRNVVYSTKAAIAYFKDLGISFKGNWYLAIAAYNCGQGKVQSAMRKSNGRTYWKLSLPKETQLYVPRLLAIAAIIKNPQKYGVKLPTVTNKPFFASIKLKRAVDLQQVADASHIDLQTLKKLNPDYNHPVQPNKQGYVLVVPLAKLDEAKTFIGNDVI
jgi:membrane-bound lytic murein transglycosylase D